MPQSPNSFITNRQFKYFGFLVAIIIVFNSCFKDDLLKEINELKTQISNMQKLNDSLNSLLNARADSLSKALSNAQKRSDSLSNVLRTKSDSLALALGLTNANLVNLSRSVDSIKTQVATINGQLTQLNLQLTSITTQLSQLNQQMGALSADVSRLAGQYAALNASLQTINTQIAALQAEQLKQLEKLNAILLQLNPPVDITTGLVAYYPFNGNAGDSSGNSNHGVVNGAILTADRFGNLNKAYSFNGTSNWVSVKSSNDLNLLSSFSITLWINANILNDDNFLLSKNAGFTGQGTWHLNIKKNFNLFQPNFNADPCFCLENISINSDIKTSTWYNITVTYQALNSLLSYFVNGKLVNQFSKWNFQNRVTNLDLLIGRESGLNGSITGFYNGKIDDVRIYNRALNQSEITYLATH